MEQVSVLNMSMELADCQSKWTFNEKFDCWCLEELCYTPVPADMRFQRLSVYAPKNLINEDGTLADGTQDVPVIFQNAAAGYAQMPHTWLDGPRCTAPVYLERGWVYVTCGCSGRENVEGKAPATLVDFKTALRFLRHNRKYLPGNWDKVVSVGSSAGGAMSTLLAVSGDNEVFLPYLKKNGAFMEESDTVWASQIYCPIIDLEHADLAYEWMFSVDKECEDSPAGPAQIMSPFQEALSAKLAQEYVTYFNALHLKHPATGEALILNEDGRSGSGYDYLMQCVSDSATKYLKLLDEGKIPTQYSVGDYLAGNYTYMKFCMPPRPKDDASRGPRPTMGEMQLRPPKGVVFEHKAPPMVPTAGNEKSTWLTWNGECANISTLDDYVLGHRRRMKTCPAFDSLTMNSPENEVFGTKEHPYVHFSAALTDAVESLQGQFPEECAAYKATLAVRPDNPELSKRVELYNPWTYLCAGTEDIKTKHYRIRVGASDPATSFMIGRTLGLKLANLGFNADYALVWEQPHCEADYPGELCDWIESLL